MNTRSAVNKLLFNVKQLVTSGRGGALVSSFNLALGRCFTRSVRASTASRDSWWAAVDELCMNAVPRWDDPAAPTPPPGRRAGSAQ